MAYRIIRTDWKNHRESLSQIREQVFMQEQQVSAADEWDDKDETATHFLVKDDTENAVGCARVLIEIHDKKTCFHIGRVAVVASQRRQGIGRALMQFILEECQKQNPEQPIFLHAQITRQTFYEHLHFHTQGDIFMDAGIPHIEMWYTP